MKKKSRWYMKENQNVGNSEKKPSRFMRRPKIHPRGKMAEFKVSSGSQHQPTLEYPFLIPSEPVIHAFHEIPEMTQSTFRLIRKKTAIEKLKDAGHRFVAFIQHLFQHTGR